MESAILRRNNLKSSGIIILVGICCGIIYPLFGDDLQDKVAFINGMSIGILGAVTLSFFEYVVFKIDSRKWTFASLIIIKTSLYFTLFGLLILAVMCFTRSIENEMGFWDYFNSAEFQNFIYHGDFNIILIYCLIVLFIINFTRQINRKIGYGILLNFIMGNYHKPIEEERIFAFIDLKKSTQMAEKIGALQFHKLLYEFFHDISISILTTKGEIYRYVGDEIVITWKMKDGLHSANCIRSYYYMKQHLKKNREKYIDLFGFVPDFHAAFHYGNVVRGEIGDVKSQFVFHGEAMFITSKIESACSELNQDLIISSNLIQRLSIPIIYEMRFLGNLKDDEKIGLYTLFEKESASLS